jgi:hypothetical protein
MKGSVIDDCTDGHLPSSLLLYYPPVDYDLRQQVQNPVASERRSVKTGGRVEEVDPWEIHCGLSFVSVTESV